MGSMGKRFQQYKQKARGRQSLVFAFDIVPYSVGMLLLYSLRSHHAPAQALLVGTCAHVTDIPRAAAEDVPRQVGQVSFVLERGSKVQYTDAATVDTERKAYWHQVLKLVRGPLVTPSGLMLSLSACLTNVHLLCRQLPWPRILTRSCPRSMFSKCSRSSQVTFVGNVTPLARL